MRIGHYQCECAAGDYEANMAKVVCGLEFAEADGAAICSFPENFLTGAFPNGQEARRHSWRARGPEITAFLRRIKDFSATCIVGFFERAGEKIYNSALVAERGKLLGVYRKAFPCCPWHSPGRLFPVFERDGVKFGVILCADSGYVEPSRILALKGARIIFPPHDNFLRPRMLVNHFQWTRADHAARAAENGVWFVRGQNVYLHAQAGRKHQGVGIGDSYIMDPRGEITVRCGRDREGYISVDADLDRFQYFRDKCVQGAKALTHLVVRQLKHAPPISIKRRFC